MSNRQQAKRVFQESHLVDHPGVQFVMNGILCERINIFVPKPHVRPTRGGHGFVVISTVIPDKVLRHSTSSTFVEEAWAGWVVHHLYFQPSFDDERYSTANSWYYRRVGQLLEMLKNKPMICYTERAA